MIVINNFLGYLIYSRYNKYAFLISTIISLNPWYWIINGIYLNNRWNEDITNQPIISKRWLMERKKKKIKANIEKEKKKIKADIEKEKKKIKSDIEREKRNQYIKEQARREYEYEQKPI